MVKNKKTKVIVQFSMLLAIEIIVSFTVLGSIPIGPLVATLSHIPVIIAAVTLGTKWGALMGFFFGSFSFIVMSFVSPNPLSFVFTPLYNGGNFMSLVICFVPRILIGVCAGLVFKALKACFKNSKALDPIAYVSAGIVGSFVNTLLVLGGIYLFFGRPYAEANQIAYEALLGAMGTVVATNGLLEAGIAAVVTLLVGKTLNTFVNKQ